MTLTDQIAQLAKDIEGGDPIDWGYLTIDEDNAYRMIASNVLEMYLSADKDDRDMILLATATKLVVENMTLNLRLMHKVHNGIEKER